MAILDIFGFEVFDKNSMEQLLINLTNERLQQHFTQVVFTQERAIYKAEGLDFDSLMSYRDNQPIVDLIYRSAKNGPSILATLEDQTFQPRGSDEAFVSALHRTFFNAEAEAKFMRDPSLPPPPYTKPKTYHAIRFVIRHTSAVVTYDATGFVNKNKSALKAELVECLKSTADATCRRVFQELEGTPPGGLPRTHFVTSQFTRSLDDLMTLLGNTTSHFIRCIAPNEEKKARVFDAQKVAAQVTALSIVESVQLRHLGFSHRFPFHVFLSKHALLFQDLQPSDPCYDPQAVTAEFGSSNPPPELTAVGLAVCREAIESLDFPEDSYRLGRTMVFLRSEAARRLQKQLEEKEQQLAASCHAVSKAADVVLARHAFGVWVGQVVCVQALYRRFRVLREIIERQRKLR